VVQRDTPPQAERLPAALGDGVTSVTAAALTCQGLSVLLAEDHAINRKLAQVMLQRMGCNFVMAHDGQQVLDLLETQCFDVVLMDVMMPVMDGLTAMRMMREREARSGLKTPVLMVTAHAITGDRERFLAQGADGYVSKPMSQKALESEIYRVVMQARAVRG
jgi:CheY-like chemotaxis protein